MVFFFLTRKTRSSQRGEPGLAPDTGPDAKRTELYMRGTELTAASGSQPWPCPAPLLSLSVSWKSQLSYDRHSHTVAPGIPGAGEPRGAPPGRAGPGRCVSVPWLFSRFLGPSLYAPVEAAPERRRRRLRCRFLLNDFSQYRSLLRVFVPLGGCDVTARAGTGVTSLCHRPASPARSRK